MLQMLLGSFTAAVVSTAAAAHPLHTTITQLEYTSESRTLRVSMRVFVDDLATAVRRQSGATVGPNHALSDAAMFAYASATLSLTDRAGQRLPMRWCGRRQTGDLVWLCLDGSALRGVIGARVDARMLFELYPDQVNIVQVTDGSHRQSLLFTRGDSAKEIR